MSIKNCLQELNELKDIDCRLDEEIYSRQMRLDNLKNFVYEEEVQDNDENSAEKSNDDDSSNL